LNRGSYFRNNYAVSEIVGGILLVLIAIIAFTVISTQLYPSPPDDEINVTIEGKVNESGFIILEHKGGGNLDSFEIIASHPNGTKIGSKIFTEKWVFGETIIPQLELQETQNIRLINETDKMKISIRTSGNDGKQHLVFEGVLAGRGRLEPIVFSENPMLISSLKTNTPVEDLICYNYNVNASFTPSSYIFNWFLDSKPLANILLPFDKNEGVTITDFSTNNNDATNNGCSWNNNGIVGGCYQFGGNDYMSLPYSFSNDGYADDITIEFWIKTTQDNMVLASYTENNICSIKIIDDVIQWNTISNGDPDENIGNTIINDGNWHHIAVNYDSSSGVSKIYVDGFLDASKNSHNPGDRLGEGTIETGFIGKSNSSGATDETWDTLTYDDFESGWGNYQDGGWDCKLYTGGTYAHQGNNAANVQDNSGVYSSFYHSSGIDVDTPGYTSIKIDFWFYAYSMEEREDFFVNYYDGSNWIRIGDYDSGKDFENYQFYHEIIWINETDYNFPNNMRLQFQCDASSDYDDVLFDQIYVNATVGSDTIANYSGMIDEFCIYNRTLTGEQIYQNYLCKKNGLTNQSVIVSDETNIDDEWSCNVTPVCETQIGDYIESNTLIIKEYGGS